METSAPAEAAAPAPSPSSVLSHELHNTSGLALGLSLLGSIVFFAAYSIVAGEPAATCSWCEVNVVDTTIRRLLYSETMSREAGHVSHVVTILLAPVVAYVAAVRPALRSPSRKHGFHNAFILFVGFLFVTGLADGTKKLFSRERPGFHFGRTALLEASNVPLERNLSFFSGDTAWAFMFIAAGLTIAYQRGYEVPRKLVIASVATASLGGMLRIVADMHWASDVLGGAIAGVVVGAGIPLLLHRRRVVAG